MAKVQIFCRCFTRLVAKRECQKKDPASQQGPRINRIRLHGGSMTNTKMLLYNTSSGVFIGFAKPFFYHFISEGTAC